MNPQKIATCFSRNDYYRRWKLLNYLYYQIYYKLIGINLSRKVRRTISKQINFARELEDDGVTMLFIADSKKLFLTFI